jgi:hypothetical protein
MNIIKLECGQPHQLPAVKIAVAEFLRNSGGTMPINLDPLNGRRRRLAIARRHRQGGVQADTTTMLFFQSRHPAAGCDLDIGHERAFLNEYKPCS